MKYLGVSIIAGSLLSAPQVVAEPVILKGDAIAETLAGARYASPSDGDLTTLFFSADGNVSGRTAGGLSDSGKWWVEDDLFCLLWTQWQGGEKNCWMLRLDDDKLYFVGEDGDVDDDGRLTR